MPKDWHDRREAAKIEDPERRALYMRISADKKPYFMRYIYPVLMKDYNTYIKNTEKNALREFQMGVDELKMLLPEQRTERMNEFLKYYEMNMPVGLSDCVMNRICRIFENEFDGYIGMHCAEPFDKDILKSGKGYTRAQFNAVRSLYEAYTGRLRKYAVAASVERIDEYERAARLKELKNDYVAECAKVCPSQETLCDIVVDICYERRGTMKFAWEMCGEQIVENLLERNARTVTFPVKDTEGTISYCGERFSLHTMEIKGDTDEYCTE